jgi:hypothetical protein
MTEQLTEKQLDTATRQFYFVVCKMLAEHTGECRPYPATAADDPLHWNLGTYPRAVELLRDLVNEHC